MTLLERLEADVAFLANRCQRTGGFSCDEKRDWGISSNSLVSVAYGVGKPEMPFDWSDYAACSGLSAPSATPEDLEVKAVLIAQRKAVVSRYPNRPHHSLPKGQRGPTDS